MKTIRKILGVSLLSLLFLGCESIYDSDNPQPGYLNKMPEKTSIGANTFGCYVNGELLASQGWYQQEGIEPYLWGSYSRYVNGFCYENNGTKTMYLRMGTKYALFSFKLDDKICLGENECSLLVTLKDRVPSFARLLVTTINVTRFDSIEHVISGKFDGITLHEEPSDINSNVIVSISISQGQFDIKYGQKF